MTYTLAAIKTFTGREGYGLNANVMRDGKRIATVIDSGNGGEMSVYFDGATREEKDANEKAFYAFTKADYDQRDGHAKWVESMKQYGADVAAQSAHAIAENWINRMADLHASRKRLARLSKTQTLFIVKGEKKGTMRTLKQPYSPAAEAWIRNKYGAQVGVILNATDEASMSAFLADTDE